MSRDYLWSRMQGQSMDGIKTGLELHCRHSLFERFSTYARITQPLRNVNAFLADFKLRGLV